MERERERGRSKRELHQKKGWVETARKTEKQTDTKRETNWAIYKFLNFLHGAFSDEEVAAAGDDKGSLFVLSSPGVVRLGLEVTCFGGKTASVVDLAVCVVDGDCGVRGVVLTCEHNEQDFFSVCTF